MSGILQLVTGDGAYDVDTVDRYLAETGIRDAGVSYTVVSIMGPQSSGKSTLLNSVVRRELAATSKPTRGPPRARPRASKLEAAWQQGTVPARRSLGLEWHRRRRRFPLLRPPPLPAFGPNKRRQVLFSSSRLVACGRQGRQMGGGLASRRCANPDAASQPPLGEERDVPCPPVGHPNPPAVPLLTRPLPPTPLAQFGTTFEEMDALRGRQQTTKGIWLAPCTKIREPKVLVIDLEGSDGRERGEDDLSFERQSASFALAVSDVVLVNMWAKDVGRETGAGKPLLKTIFQANLRLFGGGGATEAAAGDPAPPQPQEGRAPRRRTVLLFVFRDRTRTPLELLASTWRGDLATLWDGVAKPRGLEEARLEDFFEVRFASLPNYEERPEDFQAEAVMLRRRFSAEELPEWEEGGASALDDGTSPALDAPGATLLRRPATDRLPAAALSLSFARAWEAISSHRDLDLPAHRIMVANLRCAEIAADAFRVAAEGDAWKALSERAARELVPAFGELAAPVLAAAEEAYDAESRYFDGSVSGAKRVDLEARLAGLIEPVAAAQLELLRNTVFEAFSEQLQAVATEEAAWQGVDGGTPPEPGFDVRAEALAAEALERFAASAPGLIVEGVSEPRAADRARDALAVALRDRILAARRAHAASVASGASNEAARASRAAAAALFEEARKGTWERVEAAAERAGAGPRARAERALAGWAVDPAEASDVYGTVLDAARRAASEAAREAARTALPRVKERFSAAFSRDENGLPRSWGARSDVNGAASAARRKAAELLAQLVVDRSSSLAAKLAAERAVDPALAAIVSGHAAGAPVPPLEADLVTAVEWPGVPREAVLLEPSEVRAVWRQADADAALLVAQAAATREANLAAGTRRPPLWTLLAIVLLGFNEFMSLLKNPLLLLVLVGLVLLVRTVYVELDVEAELQNGALPAAISIAHKLVPTIKAVLARTIESLTDAQVESPTRSVSNAVRFEEPHAYSEGLRSRNAAPREVELIGDQDSRRDDAPPRSPLARKVV